MIDSELKQAMASLLDGEPAAGVDVDRALDAGRSARRARRIKLVVSLAVAVLVVGVGVPLAATALVRKGDRGPAVHPSPHPTLIGTAAHAAVWYDGRGLHHGNVVERTPVQLAVLAPGASDSYRGALALVRSGAVYLDPRTGDVWYHPWGGVPRVVGHHSQAGPGANPNGDTAAWFEQGGWLVVYDTAAGREISRTWEADGVGGCNGMCAEHIPTGNGFREVSAQRVVWDGINSHDIRSGTTAKVPDPKDLRVVDVQGDVEAFYDRNLSLVVRLRGGAERHYPELEERARISPSGDYVLAVVNKDIDHPTGHNAAIVDTRTGAVWRVPPEDYPWIAWSYDDVALVGYTHGPMLACDATRHTCQVVHTDGPTLLPTN